jgi:uncharacterized protein involved in tellurium resistance
MPGLSTHGKTLVGTFRRAFEEEYGVPVRVYHGARFASDDATLASIRVDGHAGGREIDLHGNMKVGTAESNVLESIGIRIQIENGKGELADDEVTLGSLRGGVAARPVNAPPSDSESTAPASVASPRQVASGPTIRFKAKGQMHCGTFCERFRAITGLHIRTYLGYSKRPSALDQTLASARADEAPPAAAVELHGRMTVEEAERAIGEAFGFAVQLIDAAGNLLPNGATLIVVHWNPQLPASTVTDVEVEIVDVIGEKGGRRRSSSLARASASDSRIAVIMRWTAAVDLDLHAYGVMKDGSFQHVYFASKGQAGVPPYVTLDRDMGIGRTAGDNREEIGVHRLREYRAILFGTKIFNPDAGDNFARYDGKVDVGFGGETIRVPLTSSDPGTWALIAAVSMEGSEPEVINLNHIASMEPTEADVWRLVLGQEPPARSRPVVAAPPVASRPAPPLPTPAPAKSGCVLMLAAGLAAAIAVPAAILSWLM